MPKNEKVKKEETKEIKKQNEKKEKVKKEKVQKEVAPKAATNNKKTAKKETVKTADSKEKKVEKDKAKTTKKKVESKTKAATAKSKTKKELNETVATKETKSKSKTNVAKKKIKEEKIEKPIIIDSNINELVKPEKIENESENKMSLNPKKIESIIPPKQTVGKKEFHTLEVVVLVILTCLISLVVGAALGSDSKTSVINNNEVVDKELQKFLDEYNDILEKYYGEVDKEALFNGALKGMINSFGDAYTGSLDETLSNNMQIELEGAYEGLGIEIINDINNDILIYDIIPSSPASRSDLKVNDKLISVNGISVTGMFTSDFTNNIVKGSDATSFSVVVERDGVQKTIELVKERIELESVLSKIYNQDGKRVGYLKVSVFAANTYEQFKNKLEELENQWIDYLIIDLRDNSGGHLNVVGDMISLFLDSSHVIYQTQSKTETKKFYSNGKNTKKYPIVILGNSFSASASEVMIGALTEEYGATLIGTKTFGKGTVQEVHTLSNGEQYKLTTKKWLTPKGTWVHNEGIRPAVEVDASLEYYENPTEENDNQLRAAFNYIKTLR